MHSSVKPNDWVILKLPSGSLRIVQVEPDSVIYIPKLGSFISNSILDRPYHLTYEFCDKQQGQAYADLRIVPASELHADTIAEENAAAGGNSDDRIVIGEDGMEFELVAEDGEVVMKSNREIIDDAARQTLTMEEIEALKRDGTDAGKDLIAKLMLSHTGINQKTSFSLAKYKLLKTKKFLRQFSILPVDVGVLTNWMIEEKDAAKILDLRDEALALAGCWANVHCCGRETAVAGVEQEPQGRWLVIDETGGLVVATMAERMGILQTEDEDSEPDGDAEDQKTEAPENGTDDADATKNMNDPPGTDGFLRSSAEFPDNDLKFPFQRQNTITLVHTNAQPNLSLMKFFNYNPDGPRTTPPHLLSTHLHTISWLQLLHPSEDATYSTKPPSVPFEDLTRWNRGKRSNYFRKRRRWAKTKAIVDDTRAGGFDGLVIASSMDLTGVLRVCLPLLRGGAHVAIYSPSVEPLAQLADLYSISRRTAFISAPPADFEAEYLVEAEDATESSPNGEEEVRAAADDYAMTSASATPVPTVAAHTAQASSRSTPACAPAVKDLATWPGNEDFPLNPTLLLNVAIQTSRARRWQVLPGRTHPVMTSRGGAEGYVLTATRSLPVRGRVAARGKYNGRAKKRRTNADAQGEGDDEPQWDSTSAVATPVPAQQPQTQ